MNPSLPEVAESAVRQLSKALGVPDLHGGAVRDHRGWLDDEIVVGYCWHALVMPSFDPWAAVGLIQMRESEFRGKKHPAAIRAAFVLLQSEQGQVGAAAEVQNDPLAEVINAAELLPRVESICLDGIGYWVCTSDCQIEATLEIHNPQAASLRAIEKGLFRLAQTVQEQSRNNELAAYLATWRQYIK